VQTQLVQKKANLWQERHSQNKTAISWEKGCLKPGEDVPKTPTCES